MLIRQNYYNGPIFKYTEVFRNHLLSQGYRNSSANNLVGVWKTLNCWMIQKNIALRSLNAETMKSFAKYRKNKGYVEWNTIIGMRPIIMFISKIFKISLNDKIKNKKSKLEKLVQKYILYLRNENRGYAQLWLNYITTEINSFLNGTFSIYSQFEKIQIQDIRQYLIKKIKCYAPATVRTIAGMFRKFFRWCFIKGIIKNPLHLYIPKISAVGQRLPKSIPEEKIKLLLQSCNQHTGKGRRLFAIITLMSELGLRKCEVANLMLDDIDWQNGVLIVRGKNKVSTMPLPVKTGKALISYLKKDRPNVEFRNLFIRGKAPYGGITSSVIQSAIREICKKIGIENIRGHQLRHSVATSMLKNGSTMYEIAQVLRHSSITNTAIYAKVDKDSLTNVVQPWPGSKK